MRIAFLETKVSDLSGAGIGGGGNLEKGEIDRSVKLLTKQKIDENEFWPSTIVNSPDLFQSRKTLKKNEYSKVDNLPPHFSIAAAFANNFLLFFFFPFHN